MRFVICAIPVLSLIHRHMVTALVHSSSSPFPSLCNPPAKISRSRQQGATAAAVLPIRTALQQQSPTLRSLRTLPLTLPTGGMMPPRAPESGMLSTSKRVRGPGGSRIAGKDQNAAISNQSTSGE